MRVCVLTSSWPLRDGDMAGWFVAEQCRYLARGEHVDVTVLAPGHPHAPRHERHGRLEVRRLTYFRPVRWQCLAYGTGIMSNLKTRPLAWMNLLPFVFVFAWAAFRYGRRADLIHAHWGPIGALAVLMRPFHRRPVVVSIRGSDILGKNGLIRRVTGWAVRYSDGVTGNTPVSYEAARALCTDENFCRYVPNGLTLPSPEDVTRLRRAGAEGSRAGVRIVSVGRLVSIRRYDLLIRAVGRVRREHPETTLTLVGDGPQRPTLETLVGELGLGAHVRFVGQVPRQEVTQFLSASDLYVSATEVDNFANAVLEAAAHACPVIATRVGFPATVVIDGVTGFLVVPGDEDALVEAMLKMLKNPPKRREAGLKMRERVEQMGLTWTECASRTVKLYRDVTEDFAGRRLCK